MKYIFLFIIFTILSNAFEVEMIDETAEAKKNSKAKDGKTIYKPIDKNIIKPIQKKIIEPMKKNVIEPIKKRVIYPIGAIPKKDNNKEAKESSSKKEDLNSSFATKDELKTTFKKEEIKVDKFFDGLRETNKTKKITPIDLEK